MEPFFIPEDVKENYKYALNQARQDRPRYENWIKEEIEIVIRMINSFDKVAVLGGLATKLINATPTFYNQFLENYDGEDNEQVEGEKLVEDDDIEVLLEYAMNLAAATTNEKKGVLPSHDDINAIYQQLSKIKININFWELSAEVPVAGDEVDHWLKTMMVQDTINVRGQGYFEHVKEIYLEIFEPHNGFLDQYYGYNATDLLNTILKLDSLVYSKIGNPYGFLHANARLEQWGKNKGYNQPDSFFPMPFYIREFVKENPDLLNPGDPNYINSYSLDSIQYFQSIFWVIPGTEKEKKIFNRLSITFGGNSIFFESKYKGFIHGDTQIKQRPLVLEDNKYYHFSLNLSFRNVFAIAEELIREASQVYYESYYRNNAQYITKDNCIERKTKSIFEKLLPDGIFYHSLQYTTTEGGVKKDNELDILGVSNDAIYIIEVKAGELNTKIRRGALKGLKDKLKETIGKGSYQCHRACKFIKENEIPEFTYAKDGNRHTLTIDKNRITAFYKITVTFEQLSMIGMELGNLIKAGIISDEYKGAWIVSIYDLMVFRDLIENEEDFKEYLGYRMNLYDRTDIAFIDEIDVLGFYFDGRFPLGPVKENEIITMTGFDNEIENYYTQMGTGFPGLVKPKKR